MTRLGFLGLGKMGTPMALRLLTGDQPLWVWNRTRAKTDALAQAGATVAQTPAEVSDSAEIIVTMLNDDASAWEVYSGVTGLLSVPVEDRLYIEMSTLRPATARQLSSACEDAGARFIESPVSGTVGPAMEGRLMALVGGREEDLERARPVLELMTRRIVHVGPTGQGSLMKLAINLPLASYWQSLAEAAALAEAGGLELSLFLDVLKDSGASMKAFPKKIPDILGDVSDVAFDVDTMHKDVASILDSGSEFGVEMPLTRVVLTACEAAQQAGLGSEDAVALVRLLRSANEKGASS